MACCAEYAAAALTPRVEVGVEALAHPVGPARDGKCDPPVHVPVAAVHIGLRSERGCGMCAWPEGVK